MVLDFRRLTRWELIAGAAGVALIVIMLAFKWYGIKADVLDDNLAPQTREGDTRSAFQSFTLIDLELLIAALAAIALPLFRAWEGSERNRASWPAAIVGVLGAVAVVLIAVRIASPPDLPIAIDGLHVSDVPDEWNAKVTRKFGVWLGLIASAGIAYGGYLSFRRAKPRRSS